MNLKVRENNIAFRNQCSIQHFLEHRSTPERSSYDLITQLLSHHKCVSVALTITKSEAVLQTQ